MSTTIPAEHLQHRVAALEARRHIERVRFESAAAFDDLEHPDQSMQRIMAAVSSDYQLSSSHGIEVTGKEDLRLQLLSYRRAVSYVITLLTGGVRELDLAGGTAHGEWVVWQPFTIRDEAWMMAGRSHDTFLLEQEKWVLNSSRLDVEILVPWRESWDVNRVLSPSGTTQNHE